ncbi:hypothetical protein [Streptomyces atratus]|uniref:hypothetical protein n=1 Tax=Streptomyces atratus TaxID=1893 RepID=UPI002254489F|nr:hypothetical protein [Streptomyces atratus]MCX5346195.1 hypothetical protein [Streptomyces atratus]
MATIEALYGLAGVLGGAAIGAVSSGFLQRSTRKASEDGVRRTQSLETKQAALEAAAAARVATRSWGLYMELMIQNLEASHPVELDTYDATVREQLDVLTTGFYRLAAVDGVELANISGAGNPRTTLSETSTLVRKVLLQRLTNTPNTSLEHEPAELRARVEKGSEEMNSLLVRLTEHFRGSPLPAGMGYGAQAAPPLSAPYAFAPISDDFEFQPFWFAVPNSRPLEGTDDGPASGLELQPGLWYLAVGNTGRGLMVQAQDGWRGILQDTDGIQRG